MKQDRAAYALDYASCRYGGGRLRFRGPARDLSRPYVAVLGGSEAFGRFAPRPFPDLLEDALDLGVVNLGIPAAGPDVFLEDDGVRRVLAGARAAVVQVLGAHNLSNRYYSVHPRRNDRFLRHSPSLQALFPVMDFSEFVFTRHMLCTLSAAAPDPFSRLRQELQAAWTARMVRLLRGIECPVILLDLDTGLEGPLGREPLFVTEDMVADVAEAADRLCRIGVDGVMGEDWLDGMIFHEIERTAALMHLTPRAHVAVARGLARALGEVA